MEHFYWHLPVNKSAKFVCLYVCKITNLMQSLSELFICFTRNGYSSQPLIFSKQWIRKYDFFSLFILNIFNYISIFWVRSNHKRVNKHVFFFCHAKFKGWKVVTFKYPHYVVFFGSIERIFLLSPSSQVTSTFLSKGKPRTLAATSIFVLLFHLSLTHSMGPRLSQHCRCRWCG